MSADWIDWVKLGGRFGGVMPVVFPAAAVLYSLVLSSLVLASCVILCYLLLCYLLLSSLCVASCLALRCDVLQKQDTLRSRAH